MSCSHRKRRVVMEWVVPRKKNLIVKDDTITVFVCDSCKAVRVDSHNEFCYTHGSFDGRLVGATS